MSDEEFEAFIRQTWEFLLQTRLAQSKAEDEPKPAEDTQDV